MNKQLPIHILSILIVFSAFVFSGCKARKINKEGDKAIQLEDIKKTENLKESTFDFTYFSLKAKAEYITGGSGQSFTMHIRMKKDSVIWVSVSAVGLELARVLVDKDSVRILDRFNKRYYVKGLDLLESYVKTPVSLLQMQYLLLGNSLYPLDHFSLKSVSEEEVFFEYTKEYIMNKLFLNQIFRIRESEFFNLVEGNKVEINYSNFLQVNKQNLAHKVSASMEAKGTNSKLELEYSGATEEPILQFPFNIPDKYARQ